MALSTDDLDQLRAHARRGIGQRLTKARLLLSARLGRHVSRREIAEAVGFRGQRRLMRYEMGLLEPDAAVTRLLCAVLGCDPRWVIFDDPAEETGDGVPDRPSLNYGDDAMELAPADRAPREKAARPAAKKAARPAAKRRA